MIQALLELFGGIFAFAGHITGGSSFPEPLSPEEEKDCIARLEAGDADDVISIGVVGLIKAVSTFNSQKGNTLATYAARCIENEILMSLRSEKKQAGEVSLSEPIGMDKDGNEISLSEVLGSDEDEIHNAVELTVAGEYLRRAMDTVLTPRERKVIELRYGLTGGRIVTQREIAKLLGISRSYISRIEKKALHKLNKELGGNKA